MISVIICTYNRERYIIKALERIVRGSNPDYEIILVDNNSTDSTAGLVKDFMKSHPQAPLKYFLETRQGLSNARNRGIREATGDVLVFLDDDSMVCDEYLTKLSAALADNPQAGAFGGYIEPLFDECPKPDWLCRWSMGWVSALDLGDKVREFDDKRYPIGANMGFRRAVLSECGEFNPELGRCGNNMDGGEEKDMFQRVRSRGHSIWYFPDVAVQHVIPEKRTTRDYVIRYAEGIGRSERIRTRSEGSYSRRIVSEMVKWCGTLVLALGYLICGRKACAKTLVLFRAHVTRRLLSAQ